MPSLSSVGTSQDTTFFSSMGDHSTHHRHHQQRGSGGTHPLVSLPSALTSLSGNSSSRKTRKLSEDSSPAISPPGGFSGTELLQ